MPKFTDQQKQVVKLVAQGLTNNQIAKKLYITEDTLSCHLEAIYKQISAKAKQEIITWRGYNRSYTQPLQIFPPEALRELLKKIQ